MAESFREVAHRTVSERWDSIMANKGWAASLIFLSLAAGATASYFLLKDQIDAAHENRDLYKGCLETGLISPQCAAIAKNAPKPPPSASPEKIIYVQTPDAAQTAELLETKTLLQNAQQELLQYTAANCRAYQPAQANRAHFPVRYYTAKEKDEIADGLQQYSDWLQEIAKRFKETSAVVLPIRSNIIPRMIHGMALNVPESIVKLQILNTFIGDVKIPKTNEARFWSDEKYSAERRIAFDDDDYRNIQENITCNIDKAIFPLQLVDKDQSKGFFDYMIRDGGLTIKFDNLNGSISKYEKWIKGAQDQVVGMQRALQQ